MTAPGRTYADALALLDTLQSNRTVTSSISTTSQDMNLHAIPEMLEWTAKAGYTIGDFAKGGLRCVHVSGTKGKGSVCVMVENILLQYQNLGAAAGRSLGKVGLYTSPHLVHVRERIRINGSPISEPLFTRYFFELWDRFSDAASLSSHPDPNSSKSRPGYFRYLTLLAFHTFLEEGVESAIVECGIGGEYDSTNILPLEAVTTSAITSLGIDHTGMLGETIEKIAWHKAGIMKRGVPTYTIEQPQEAQAVLNERAKYKEVHLTTVKRLSSLQNEEFKLSLGADFQKDNASLAVAVAASHLRSLGITEGVPDPLDIILSDSSLPDRFVLGLETVRWPGRWQVLKDGNIEWHIDGAHTMDSISATAQWFRECLLAAISTPNPPTGTMLIFNQQDRDAEALLRTLLTVLQHNDETAEQKRFDGGLEAKRNPALDHTMPKRLPARIFTFAAFCTNTPFKGGEAVNLELQTKLGLLYQRIDSNALHIEYGSVEEAVELARRVSEDNERILVLVTGSLHLVGGLLQVLREGGYYSN